MARYSNVLEAFNCIVVVRPCYTSTQSCQLIVTISTSVRQKDTFDGETVDEDSQNIFIGDLA